jgi:hypothetical protein
VAFSAGECFSKLRSLCLLLFGLPVHRSPIRGIRAIRGLKLTPFPSRSVAAATFTFYVASPGRSVVCFWVIRVNLSTVASREGGFVVKS